MKLRHLIPSLLLASLFAIPAASQGSVILYDDFNNGVPITGAAVHPNQWSASGGTVSETDGKLRISTAVATSAWGQTLFSTSVAPSLNFFQQPLSISVRDFASGGTGATATTGQNFRLGLLARSSTSQSNIDFYQGGDDGIALSITNGTSYALRYKSDRANNGDPHLGARALQGLASGSVATGLNITGFDLTLASTSWSMNILVSDGSTLSSHGDWVATDGSTPKDLATALGTWGNATDGWGSSALVLQAQKGIEGSGSVYMELGSLMVTPEPGRFLLGALGLGMLAFIRRR